MEIFINNPEANLMIWQFDNLIINNKLYYAIYKIQSLLMGNN